MVLHQRNLQAFGINVGGHAVEDAANVLPVRHAGGKRNDLALVKNRDGKRQVVQVGTSDVGVVGQQNVAGVDVVQPPMVDLGLDHVAHAADEHGQPQANRQGLALPVEQTHGEVQGFVNDHVVGRAHQHRLHLFGGRNQAVAHQLHRHGVGFFHGCGAFRCARSDSCFFGFRTCGFHGSNALSGLTFGLGHIDVQIAVGIDLQAVAGLQHGGGGVLFDQGGAF